MKRMISLLLLIALIISFFPIIPLEAKAVTEEGYTYTVSNGEATITGYTGTGGDISIPSTLGGCSVTQIGESAFRDCTALTAAIIPDSVATIGVSAFWGCDNLASVTIGNSVNTIENSAFRDCSSLASVTIPNSVLIIDNNAFSECDSLTSVIIGDGVTTIGESAFYECTSLNSVNIGDSVKTIGVFAFAICTSLTSVTIPDSVTVIDNYAFACAVGYTSNLVSVTIGNGVTTIGDFAFSRCNVLSDVYYNGTQSQWQAVSVGEGNEYLQNATVHFPEPEITDYAYTVENGKAVITKYNGLGGDVVVPAELDGYPVTQIGEAAFSECTSLTSVEIPNDVTKIGEWAFLSCNKLTTVNIPSSVTVIGEGAFYGCSSLVSVAIPDSVTKIGAEAFAGCIRLTSVTIPNSVTAIYESTFYYCENLTTVTIPDSVTYVAEGAFDNCNITKLIVAGESKTITDTMIVGEGTLQEVVVPNSVTKIGEWAFLSCNKLTTVNIPDSVSVIGEGAFYGCSSLASIAIPDSVTKIGAEAFAGCIRLTSVTIPNSMSAIYESTFYYCENLTTVTIPDSVLYIGESAFDYCNRLEDVHYSGIESKWNEIEICEGNNALTSANIHCLHVHDYSVIPELTVAATCMQQGYKEYTCTCGEKYRADYVSALGHSFTNYVSNNDATCTEYGTETAKCDRCEETDTRIVDGNLADHSYTKEVIEPTCTSSGHTIYTCACGYSFWDDYVVALGHSFTNYVSNNDATCKDGTETAKCDRCEETDTRPEVGSAKGHDYETVVSAPTCRDGGFTTYICRRCEYAYVDDWVEPLGHSYTNACDTTCNRADCGATRTITHSYAAATCTKAKTCKVCGVTSGKALGHSYKSGVCTRCKYKPAGAKITTQPVNVAVGSGKTAKVTVKATGSGLKYTWYYAKKGSSKFTKASVTSASYSVKMSSSVNGRKVYCVVTDKYGNTVKSNVVTLYKGTAAKIKTQPKGVTVASGKTGKLTIKASGSGLSYTWYVKNKGASSFKKVGKSSKTYSFKMTDKLNGAQVYCVVKDKYGITVKSAVVTIKLAPKAKITTQPKNVMVAKGKTAKVTLKATGDGLKYTWYYAKSGSSKFKKASGKSPTYSVKMSASVNGRRVYCVVKDKYGNSVKSSIVTLKMK